jgi:hypothetical protein
LQHAWVLSPSYYWKEFFACLYHIVFIRLLVDGHLGCFYCYKYLCTDFRVIMSSIIGYRNILCYFLRLSYTKWNPWVKKSISFLARHGGLFL